MAIDQLCALPNSSEGNLDIIKNNLSLLLQIPEAIQGFVHELKAECGPSVQALHNTVKDLQKEYSYSTVQSVRCLYKSPVGTHSLMHVC